MFLKTFSFCTSSLIVNFFFISLCHRLRDFEIDGNLDNDGGLDWVNIINGTRNTTANPNTQNSCTQTCCSDIHWTSKLFCDLYGNTDQSVFPSSALMSTPSTWVPLITGSAPPKADITNVYIVGSDIDATVCAGFERKGTGGDVYLDMEFNQFYDHSASCSYLNTAQAWRCDYPVRQVNDSQISFTLSGNSFELFVYRWNGSTFVEIANQAGSGIVNAGAIKAAINTVAVNAGDWKYINQQDTERTTIDAEAFFEACVYFTGIGFAEFCASSVIMKSRSSSSINASPQDTSGVIPFPVCVSFRTFPPTPSPVLPTPPTTPIPTRPPTTPMPTPPTLPPSPNPTRPPTSPQPTQPPTTPNPTASTTATQSSSTSSTTSGTSGTDTTGVASSTSSSTTSGTGTTTNGNAGTGAGAGTEEDSSSGGSMDGLMLGIIIGAAVLVLLAIGLGIWYCRKKKRGSDFYI